MQKYISNIVPNSLGERLYNDFMLLLQNLILLLLSKWICWLAWCTARIRRQNGSSQEVWLHEQMISWVELQSMLLWLTLAEGLLAISVWMFVTVVFSSGHGCYFAESTIIITFVIRWTGLGIKTTCFLWIAVRIFSLLCLTMEYYLKNSRQYTVSKIIAMFMSLQIPIGPATMVLIG